MFDKDEIRNGLNQGQPKDKTMCEYCAKHGHGNRWYLNPENYSDDLLKDKARQRIVDQIAGWGVDYYIERSTRRARFAHVPLFGSLFKAAVDRVTPGQHAGQVVALEEALAIVDLARDFVALPCMCRRLVGGKEMMTCLNFGPIKELTIARKPEEPMEELPAEEVKARLRKFDKQGFIHQVVFAKLPFPIVICNCDRNYCTSLKMRFLHGIDVACLKGHGVCVIDHSRCDGCSGRPECLRLCQFGALRWVPTDEVVVCEPQSCFGCGVCRQACSRGAIRMVPRESLASVANVW